MNAYIPDRLKPSYEFQGGNALRNIKIGVIVLFLIFAVLGPSVFACEGEDYQRTMKVVNYSIEIGYELGYTGDLNLFMRRVKEINRFVQTLPPSCRRMIEQMGAAMSYQGSMDTTCIGGVCCDSTGCYR